MSIFNEIISGLREAAEFEQGKRKLSTKTVKVPDPEFNKAKESQKGKKILKGVDNMLTELDVARYFLAKDVSSQVFNKNGDGDKRLGLYLYLAQIVYIAKTGTPLMDAKFYACDNGAVVPKVQENYAVLLSQSKHSVEMQADIKNFLDRFYKAFAAADLDELIEISREDEAWAAKYGKAEQKMDLMEYADLYRTQYKDIVKVLDRMEM